jgi:hypothetical protein
MFQNLKLWAQRSHSHLYPQFSIGSVGHVTLPSPKVHGRWAWPLAFGSFLGNEGDHLL